MNLARGEPERLLGLPTAALLVAVTVSACSGGAVPAVPSRTVRHTATPRPSVTPRLAVTPSGGIVPTRLSVPAIDLSSPVVEVGETPDGDLQSPPDWDSVGWFSPGFRPGAPGHAVLNGHLDTNLADRPTAVFWNLRQLHAGDAVTVTGANGTTLQYTVTALDRYPAESAPLGQIFGPSTDSVLELVTCAGTWRGAQLGYSQRLVVTATLDRA